MNNIDTGLTRVVQGRAFLQQQIFQTLGRARAGAEPATPARGVDSAATTIAAALRDSLGDAIGATSQSASRYAVHDLAQALRSALESSGDAGKARVDGLLERLDAGFEEARRRLAQAGFDEASIDSSIAAFRERLADLLDAYARGIDRPSAPLPAAAAPAAAPSNDAPPAAPANDAAPLAATATRATYVRKESLRLEVLTQEGDVVSLKIRNKDVLQATGASAVWADAAAAQGRVDVLSTSKVRIEVRGDLNDAELAAIQELASQAGTIADRFFAGDVAAAFDAGAALDLDGSQIAAAGLKLAVRERFTLQQVTTAAPAAPARATAPAARPTASQGEPAATTAPTPPLASTAPAAQPSTTPAATTVDTPAAPAPTRAEVTGRLGAQIASLLAWAQTPTDAGRLEIRMQFKLRLVVTLAELATPVQPTAGDALRQDTLRQLTSPAPGTGAA